MDLAMALAERRGADIVVANDPDADRCAVAVPTMQGWRMLRGDEVGVLLAEHLLSAATEESSRPRSCRRRCSADGCDGRTPYVETLTGFKWIGRVPGLAFGYEEALGYCVDPEHVNDKDGVSALLRSASWRPRPRPRGDPTTSSTTSPSARPARHRPAVGAGHRPRLRSGGDGAVARAPRRTSLGGFAVESADDLCGSADLPPDRGSSLPARRGRPCDRPPERHRAQDQVLPRGGRAGAARRRRRRGPDRRGRPAGRARQRHQEGRRNLSRGLEAHRLVEGGDRLLGRGHPPRVREDLEDLLRVGTPPG